MVCMYLFFFSLENESGFQSTICPDLVMNNITYEGRQLTVKELTHFTKESSVRVYIVDNFLSKEECDGLSAVHVRFVKESNELGPIICFAGLSSFKKYLKEAGFSDNVSEKDFLAGTLCINETFSEKLSRKFSWSYSTAFYPSESKFSKIYEQRIEAVTGLLSLYGGKFQVTSYPKNVGKYLRKGIF